MEGHAASKKMGIHNDKETEKGIWSKLSLAGGDFTVMFVAR